MSLDNVVVYGVSAGGLTAIELAGKYQDKVTKLILASAVSKEWLDKQSNMYKTAQKIFKPKFEKIVWGTIRFFSSIFPNMIAKSFYSQFSKKPIHKLKREDIQELILAMKYYGSKKGFLNDINQNIHDETFSKIICPVLIIHSKNDNSVPFNHALHAKKMIKNSELVELNNDWGHLFWIGTDSAKPIEKIIEFIDR